MTSDRVRPPPVAGDDSPAVLRQRLAAVMNSSRDVIVSLDETGRIQGANTRLHQYLGRTVADLVGEPIDVLLADADEHDECASPEDIRDTLMSEADTTTRVSFVDASGDVWPMDLQGSPIRSSDGSILGLVAIASPIDGEGSSDSVVKRQRDEFALFNQVLRHDIRNDANLILEVTRGLRKETDENDAMLEQIEDGATRIVDLTERARELIAALEALDTDRVPVELGPILHEEVAKASTVSPAATVVLEGDPPEVTVLANDMLGAVFRNLLTNGIYHSEAAEPDVRVSTTVADDRVMISVADNGPGVPEGVAAAVEEGTISLDNAATVGFGLYIVLTLLDRFDGELTLESNEPRGSVFTVALERATVD